jgi:integrase
MEEGSIEQRIEGRKYLIRWTCMGCETYGHTDKRRHNKIINGDWVEASKALNDVLRPVPGQVKPLERTFASYADHEWAQYVQDKWKASTQITQGSFVNKWIRPYFDAMILTEIRPTDVVSFLQSLEPKDNATGLSRKTRRTIYTILGTMFSYAVELELLGKSPVTKRQAPKLDRKEKPTLSEAQFWQLWDAFNTPELIRYRAFYGVLLFTTIRTGEALGLKWADVDFANRTITVRREIYRGRETTPKTVTSLRSRIMPKELYAAMLNQRTLAHYREPENYVFASSSGRPLNPDQLREALQKVLRETLKIHLGAHADGLHLLRHTGGSLIYQKRGVKAAQEALGHSSPRVTLEVYAHEPEGSAMTVPIEVFQRPAERNLEHEN